MPPRHAGPHSRQVVVISLTTGASSSLVKTCLPHTCKQLQNVCAKVVEEELESWCRKGAEVLQRCAAPAGRCTEKSWKRGITLGDQLWIQGLSIAVK